MNADETVMSLRNIWAAFQRFTLKALTWICVCAVLAMIILVSLYAFALEIFIIQNAVIPSQ